MKLYNSNQAPSPRRVRIFLAEKGLTIPRVEVDLAKLEHKTADFLALNPFETIPVLELDDGTRIAEIDRDLSLYRGDLASAEPVRLNPCRTSDDRDVAAPARIAPLLSDRAGGAPQPSENGGDGKSTGPRLGGGQSAKGASSNGDNRRTLARPAVHRRRPVHGRRYHWPGGAGFRQVRRGSRSRPNSFTSTAGARR